jgi:16S rRNA (uracil1498-N3)-methyltransferase
MRLSRIFVQQPLIEGARLLIDSDTSHYLRNVLRLKAGAVVALFNGDDCCDYPSLLSYQGKQAIALVQRQVPAAAESELPTEVVQGLSRGDHMDWMIQKTTELGVKQISIFNARHSQIPLKPKQTDKRLAHWRAVAIKACEQSGRHRPPQISFYQGLTELLDEPVNRNIKFLLDFDGEGLQNLTVNQNTEQLISLLVGPEGGLAESEIKLARDSGFDAVRLGPRVLRTETAAITALAIVQSMWGDV